MKKFILASSIAFLGLVSVVGAQNVSFQSDLKVGSSGPDVVALQTWLINNGYSIPAISSGAAAKGTFGAQTRVAVQKYQTAKGLPSTGFVGPLTRAKLNGTAVASSACPITGWVQATYQGVSYCVPPGYNSPTSPTTAPQATITTPGVAGTLTFALQSTPANSTSVDKGSVVDVARYKLQASASDMAVSSLALDFNKRLWLTVTGITIKDDSGAVVAQKTGLTQSDFTELTSGTSYRLTVPVSGYVVPKSSTRYLVITVSTLAITDQCSGGCTVTINQAQVRSIDGTGVTDTQTETADRSYNFTGSLTGQIVLTANENSPPSMLVQISTSGKTENVVLGVADLKSQNIDGLLRSMTIYVNTNVDSAGTNITTLVSDVKLQSGDKVYSADSIEWATDGSTVTFRNLNIPLPKDERIPVAIMLDINKDTNNTLDGMSASSTLVASGTAGGTSNNPVVEDSNFNTIDINDAPLATSDITFSASNATIDSLAAVTTSVATAQNGILASLGYSFTFTLEAGDNNLYIPSDPYKLFATSTTGFGGNASSTWSTSITPTPSVISGDDTTGNKVYIIPARAKRTFMVVGRSDNTNGTNSPKVVLVTAIKYGTTATNPVANNVIYYNLGTFKISY